MDRQQLSSEQFTVDDLLDFSSDEVGVVAAAAATTRNDVVMENVEFDSHVVHGGECSAVGVVDSCNSSSLSGSDNCLNFNYIGIPCGDELAVPHDDLADLEWLSSFVEESFSCDELQKFHLISGTKPRPESPPQVTTRSDENSVNYPNPTSASKPEMVTVPGKARSKRSRAAPIDWASRLLLLSDSTSPSVNASPDPEFYSGTSRKPSKPSPSRKQPEYGEGRKCLHCATDKTPQWRTGPRGPKTLCNACGVRFKSGRLVPEYRPAASPTFVLTKHSNSHRKVMELRRQKELQNSQPPQTSFPHHHHHHHHRQHHQGGDVSMTFDHEGSSHGNDYLLQHMGPDFRQLI